MAVTVDVRQIEEDAWQVAVHGPSEVTILARNVEVEGPIAPWADGYARVLDASFVVRAPAAPFVGVAPGCPSALSASLRRHGYIVEDGEAASRCSVCLGQGTFVPVDEVPVLDQLAQTRDPLLRLGCWPRGMRSALCVTGDIDALTVWDYALRFLGR
jgi:hypothetical protein